MCRALGRLQGNVAGKAFGDNHVHRPLAYVVAFDKAVIVEMRELAFAQDAPRLSDLLEPFDFLYADVEKTNGRTFDVKQHARHRAAHRREIDEVRFVGADRSANIKDDGLTLQRRPQRSDG